MSNLVDFEFHRLMKATSAGLAAFVEPLRQDLAHMQAIDISKLNGRELCELRDRILHAKWMLLVCDARTRDHIVEKLGDRLPGATFEEMIAAAPELPMVRFV